MHKLVQKMRSEVESSSISINDLVINKAKEITELSAKVNSDFDAKYISEFINAVKYLRTFLQLLRMHNSAESYRMPDRLKKLYYIAKTIDQKQYELIEISEQVKEKIEKKLILEKSLLNLKKDWQSIYTDKLMIQFIKNISKHTFKDLPQGVLNNFLNTISFKDYDKLRSKILSNNDSQIKNVFDKKENNFNVFNFNNNTDSSLLVEGGHKLTLGRIVRQIIPKYIFA